VSCVGHYHLHVVSPTANPMYGKARVWDWLNAALEDYFGAGDWHAAAVLKRISIVGEYPPPTVILDRDALKNMGGARAFLALAMSPC
jgi:3',5'-cyclic AMP phosphodiesterase CpdA